MRTLFNVLIHSALFSWAIPSHSDIIIDYLKDHPELIPVCAWWSYSTWGHYTPGKTYNDYLDSRTAYLHDTQLPLTLLAFDNERPVGMCSLTATRGLLPELTPWLCSLYVEPTYRRQGIGSLLEQAVCKKARSLGYTTIYCFTSDTETVQWYESRGWKSREKAFHNNHWVTVLHKDL